MIQPEEIVPVFDLVANHEKSVAMMAAYEAEQAKIGQPKNDTLEKIKGKKMMFYYQNQNYHETNEDKENELQHQLNKYLNVIGKHTGHSWWTYIRHFIIKN